MINRGVSTVGDGGGGGKLDISQTLIFFICVYVWVSGCVFVCVAGDGGGGGIITWNDLEKFPKMEFIPPPRTFYLGRVTKNISNGVLNGVFHMEAHKYGSFRS